MSATKAIVILANSIRSGHRCVAGKELIRNGDDWTVGPWIRLTDPGTKDGSVRYELTRCRGGEEIGVLDVVEVPMQKHLGHEDHPEDWFVDTSQRWTHLSRLPHEELSRLSDAPTDLWRDGGDGRSVPDGYVAKMGEPGTLFLIENPLTAGDLVEREGDHRPKFGRYRGENAHPSRLHLWRRQPCVRYHRSAFYREVSSF